MAFNSTIVIDLALNTATADIFINGELLDHLVYDQDTNNVTLAERADLNVVIGGFVQILRFYNTFNAAIIKNFFQVSQFQYSPFTPIDVQLEDSGTDTLTFSFQNTPSDTFPIFGYVATYPGGDIYITKRDPEVISYAQWLYYIYQNSNFNLFIFNAYNL